MKRTVAKFEPSADWFERGAGLAIHRTTVPQRFCPDGVDAEERWSPIEKAGLGDVGDFPTMPYRPVWFKLFCVIPS